MKTIKSEWEHCAKGIPKEVSEEVRDVARRLFYCGVGSGLMLVAKDLKRSPSDDSDVLFIRKAMFDSLFEEIKVHQREIVE